LLKGFDHRLVLVEISNKSSRCREQTRHVTVHGVIKETFYLN